MRCAGAVGGPGRAEFSPAVVAGRAGSGAVRPGAGAGVSTERTRAAGSGARRSWLRALAAAGPCLRCLAGRRRTSGSSRAGAQGPGGSGSSHPSPAPARPARHGAVSGRSPAGGMGWVRRFAASLFVFAVLGTALPAAAQTDVWTATLTPDDFGSGFLGCSNDTGEVCTNPSLLSEDSFNHDSTDYTITALFVRPDGSFVFAVDRAITTADTNALTLIVGTTSLALADATSSSDGTAKTWSNSGVSLTLNTPVSVKLTSSTAIPPVSANNTVMTRQDSQYSFFISDFNYGDANGDWSWSLKILTLPSAGTLKHDTRSISAGYEMHWTDLGRQALKYVPPAGQSGAGLGSFTFKVNDGQYDSIATYTMTVDVAASNSAQPETAHCTSDTNELWCATITVGDEGSGYYGYGILGWSGSIAPSNRFRHGSHSDGRKKMVRVDRLVYGGSNRRLFFGVASASGGTPNGLLGSGNFKLEFGTGSSKRSVDIINPGKERVFRFRNHGLNWSVGQKVPVKFLRTSGRQVVVDPPTVTSTPAISAAGGDSQWTVGETVEVTLEFSEAVEVNTTGGTPSVTLALTGGQMRRAAYLRGSGTAELVFAYTLIGGDGVHTSMGVSPNSLTLNGGTIRSVATSVDATLTHNGAFVMGGAGRSTQGPTVRFSDLPANHDGTTAFTVELHFSAEPEGLSYRTVQGGLLEVQGAAVTRAVRATPGSNMGWRVTMAPSGDGEIEIGLPARKCGKPNAVCIGGRPLEQAAQATIPGTASVEPPPPPEVPLTASFSGAPAEHDGTGSFELRFRLSEEPSGLSYRTVQSGLFDVSGGTIGRAWRLQKGNNAGWGLRIEPSGFGDVTLGVRATTDCAGTPGVCTSDGRMLGGGLQARIAGPPTLSVADAEVDENSGAVLDFSVTLSRALAGPVTVGYRTADGSANAGEDYTNTTGTLTFAAGDTSRTVSVPVLDDEHDEGSETMTLRLSSPSPARVKLADAEATGTINNTDAMPQAWLARFGRTVAEHVLDAVEARREAGAKPGMEASLAGQRIGGAALPEDVAGGQEAERGRSLTDWLKDGTDPQRQDLGSRTIAARDLLTGSSFALTATTKGNGLVSIWGRGAVTRFTGREGDLTVDGEVASGMLGADWTQGAWKTGLLVSHSLGDGGYRGASAGTMTSTLTGIFPWVRHALGERLSVWGVAGYGEGSLTLEPEEQAKIRTDLDLWMAAAGLRGVLLDGGHDGPTLAVDTDAMIVRTSSDAVSGGSGNLAAAEAGVTRLRLGLEGSQPFRLAEGATLTPSVEIGVRHDGGDAETGFGVDIGGGLAWSDTRRGITAAFRGRALLTHEADGFRERGLSGSLSWDPQPASDRGPRASIAQTLGGSASGGMNALLARDTLTGLAANDNGDNLQQRRLEARFGYGFAAFGDRFTSVPEIAVGLSNAGRDYSLGWRLVRGPEPGGDAGSLELSFEATRRESANDNADQEHAIGFKLRARF